MIIQVKVFYDESTLNEWLATENIDYRNIVNTTQSECGSGDRHSTTFCVWYQTIIKEQGNGKE